jgi:hypothetical protein
MSSHSKSFQHPTGPVTIHVAKKKRNIISVQSRIERSVCDDLDRFAQDKGMFRGECLRYLIEECMRLVKLGNIK